LDVAAPGRLLQGGVEGVKAGIHGGCSSKRRTKRGVDEIARTLQHEQDIDGTRVIWEFFREKSR